MKNQQMIEETIKEIAECNKESCQDCKTICTYFYAIKRFCELFFSEDSVVLSREKYEMLVNQYKNLEIKYSNLCDNYRLCKDANETLKQNIIITRKEIAEEFLQLAYDRCLEKSFIKKVEELAKQFGVEIKE